MSAAPFRVLLGVNIGRLYTMIVASNFFLLLVSLAHALVKKNIGTIGLQTRQNIVSHHGFIL
jgi:hypothetical protein